MRTNLYRCLALCALAVGLPGPFDTVAAEPAGKRPNILFILVDDQSPFDFKFYNPKSSLQSPNIDRLAAEGMVLDGAYHMGAFNGAVCTPSRHMIMTGRTVWHLPIGPGAKEHCPPNIVTNTLPAVFNRAGYATMRTCKIGNSYDGANKLFTVRRDASKRGGTDESGSAWHGEQVLDYLNERETSKETKPFLIYFGFSHPHDTRDGKPELLAKYGAVNHTDKNSLPPAHPKQPALPANYLPAHPFHHGHPNLRDEVAVSGVWTNRDERTIRNELGREFACSENIDIQIGRVLAKLKAMGELENTYIIYTADHGMAIGRHGLQGKQNLYEHTWRVPFVVKGPGIKPGSRAPGNIYLLDVLATLCDLAGVTPPESNEGLSFKPVLEGKQQSMRDVLFGVYNGGTKPGMRSVKKGDWKLIKYDVLNSTVRETQLFNLAENPDEFLQQHHEPEVIALTGVTPARHQVNLANDPRHADKLKEMEALLLAEMRRLNDPWRLWNQPKDGLTASPETEARNARPASAEAETKKPEAATKAAEENKPANPRAEARRQRQAANNEASANAAHALTDEPDAATTRRSQAVAPPAQGERIVLIGNGFAERDVYYSRIETELALRFPNQTLILRNMGHVGDTPGFRPHPSRSSQWAFPGAEKFHPDKQVHKGKGFYGTPDQWLTHLKADTIVAFFGYNESFDGPGKVANFEAELDAWVQHTLSKAYNGQAAPRLVLVSPIAFEDQSAKRDLPKGNKENANLTLYTAAIASVAQKHSLTYVDLFKPTLDLFAKATRPLTTGGFVPNDEGYQRIAEILANGLYGHQSRASKADPALVHSAVKAKDYFWNADYNLVNGVHAYGQRYNPYGPQNYPDEVLKTREMTALRDTLIHEVAAGKKIRLSVDDSRTRPLPPVPSNFAPSNKNGSERYLYGDDAVKSLTVPAGYKVELFASEKEFPNLANPMQLSFDNKGRLWVAVMPTYPHYRPGDALPNDKIIIYEDTNGDGKADKETIFADKLHLPIGFEFAPEGVYVSQEPNLVLLRDTNGDNKADRMEIILGGFDTHDTHHAISAYTADPSGAFMLCEGVFLHSNIETPYGPVRCVDGGFFRYSPQRGHLERTIQMSIPNPWGYVFDEWGQDFLLFTSSPTMNWALPLQIKPTFGSKAPPTADLIPKGHAVRPTSGMEIVSSRHFPDEVQGDILLANAIGFLGIKQHQIEEDGTGWKTAHRHDLLKSSDGNFRPVDLEFAPDGSLYVIDWHNVLIGHMQHNARDPLRDHVHGRIYRITYPSRPLVKPALVAGAPMATLLENLKAPESRTRYRTRRELRGRATSEVLPAVKAWAAKQTDTHAKLEALWTTWGLNATDESLLRELLASNDHRARAAAVRVLRYNTHRIAAAAALLEKAAADSHGRVRLEATIAASWFPDTAAAKKIAAVASAQPLDTWSKEVVKTTLDRLGGVAEDERLEFVAMPVPAHLKGAAARQFTLGQQVYHRDAHCTACHLPNGKGLEGAVPALEKSPWVTDSPERLIKLTLYGLMGPIEVNGVKFDGQVPMTPFGGLLNDNEVAAVLTFVRNSFGNKADPITPAAVKKVREANPGRLMLYNTEELLKEHPLK